MSGVPQTTAPLSRRRKTALVALSALLALGLAGCKDGGGDTAPGPAEQTGQVDQTPEAVAKQVRTWTGTISTTFSYDYNYGSLSEEERQRRLLDQDDGIATESYSGTINYTIVSCDETGACTARADGKGTYERFDRCWPTYPSKRTDQWMETKSASWQTTGQGNVTLVFDHDEVDEPNHPAGTMSLIPTADAQFRWNGKICEMEPQPYGQGVGFFSGSLLEAQSLVPGGPAPDTDPDPDHMVGSVSYSAPPGGTEFQPSGYAYDLSYDLRRLPCDEAPGGDCDGDRLPDAFEKQVSHTNPDDDDSDDDGFLDSVEFAAGADPLSRTETPDSLGNGGSELADGASGEAGVTCGTTQFEWVTPALEQIGVPAGANACVLLLGNDAVNAVLDTVIEHRTTIAAELATLASAYVLEGGGIAAVDWSQALATGAWTGAKVAAKREVLKALRLTKVNMVFTAGTVAGLAAVPMAVNFAIDQVRDGGACVEIQVGEGSDGNLAMSWHLVYNSERTTDADLSYAGARRQVDRSFRPDGSESVRSNLRCAGGSVAGDGSAAGLFGGTVTTAVF
jgi:hypothetical protein